MAKAMDFSSDPSITKGLDYGYDFQPLYYLTLARKNGDRPTLFQYFSTNEYYSQKMHGTYSDITGCYTSVHVEGDDRAKMESAKVFGQNNHAKYADRMLDVFLAHGDPSGWKTDDGLKAELKSIGVTDKNMSALINKMSEVVGKEIVIDDDSVHVSEDTLDRFKELVRECYDVIREHFYEGGPKAFPAISRMDCSKCSYKDMCTLADMSEEEGDSDE